MKCVAYGEDAAYVDLEIDTAPDRAARTRAAAEAIQRKFPEADVVVGAGAIAVHGVAPSYALREAARLAAGSGQIESVARLLRRIDVVYDGPDLEPVARALGLAPGALVELHAGRDYVVEVVGFLPGFAYLGALDPRLVTPRRASPRTVVPAASVGIAGAFTGIYPFASPGGWNLIGRALDVVPFDSTRAEASMFRVGDRVRFVPADPRAGPPPGPPAAAPAGQRGGCVRVVRAPPGATIQDAGRGGQLGRGLPPSGPLDPVAYVRANVAVGNPPGAAAVEVPLGSMELVAEGELVVSIDGEPARRIADGGRIEVAAGASAVRYVAVRGGIDVPLVLGARATLLVARFGGLEGRALTGGDRLPVGDRAAGVSDFAIPESAAETDAEGATSLEIDPGPHVARFPEGALEALVAGSFDVSPKGDRVGVRLDGDRVPRHGADVAGPVPMRRGAVQVSTDGTPIVLGPDHPVTGGYPVIAVLRCASQTRLARLRPGRPVRFVLAPPAGVSA